MSDPTIFDLSVREQLDAVAMTRAYLDAVEWKNRDFRPVIQPEVTPATDSLLLSHDVILYHCVYCHIQAFRFQSGCSGAPQW